MRYLKHKTNDILLTREKKMLEFEMKKIHTHCVKITI